MEKLTALVIANTVVIDEYEKELARFEKIMQANKPHPDTFATTAEYTRAYNEWQMAWSCDRPNKPGYYRAAND